MVDQGHRRFTDQEVALVLRRAAELEERKAQPQMITRGLTLAQLQEIAAEVGIRPDIVAQAAAELQVRRRNVSIFGPPTVSKQIRAIPRKLSADEVQRLIQLVEASDVGTGTVTEALGSVRWTSVTGGQRLQSTTQVVITPGEDETQIQVTQRQPARLPALLHLLPAGWGAMGGVAVMGSLGLAAVPAFAAVVSGMVVGGAVGRGLWYLAAGRTARRVARLAGELAEEAGPLPISPPRA